MVVGRGCRTHWPFSEISQIGHRRRDVGCSHIFVFHCTVVVDRTLYFVVTVFVA